MNITWRKAWRNVRWMVLALAVLPVLSKAAEPLPDSPSPFHVLDQAGWLDQKEFGGLNDRLAAYERESSSQLLVAVFKKLPDGAELFDFCQRVFDQWRPGQSGKDNGVILFVFEQDRKLRIHTGYGLEGALPDARAKQIIADVITPRLREGRKADAVMAGADAIIAATRGEYKGSDVPRDRPGGSSSGILIMFALIVAFALINRMLGYEVVMTGKGSRRFRRLSGGWNSSGGSSGWGGWSGGSGGGGFSGGGGRSGGGGASGGW